MKKSTAVKKARSVQGLAAMLGITHQAIYKWGEKLPADRVQQLRSIKPEWFKKGKS